MKTGQMVAQGLLAMTCGLAAQGAAQAQEQAGWQPFRFDNWGYYQKNANGSNQWQYRPRGFATYRFDNGWTFLQRGDIPLLYTNATGPGNPAGGYSGGVGNIMLESIVDTPEVAPRLSLRASLRLVFPSPKPSPFGTDNQYQIAPLVGVTYRMPDVLRGVTVSPFLRYFWGFDAREPNTRLVSSLNLFPNVSFGLGDHWSLALYPENPIVFNNNTNAWFVPLDFLFVNQASKSFQFAIGGAFKLGNPANPNYDYLIQGRATFLF